ncbi:MAG: hypothetical protein FWE01_02210 [Firmicutes bacterium]|nr:hypothetical protein [Bacillota bacterium]
MEDRLRRLKFIVVGAVSLLFILVIVLVFQIGIGSNRNAQIRRHERDLRAMQDELYRLTNDTNFLESDRFVREFLLSQGWAVR